MLESFRKFYTDSSTKCFSCGCYSNLFVTGCD